jgi:hypothetical protein
LAQRVAAMLDRRPNQDTTVFLVPPLACSGLILFSDTASWGALWGIDFS